LSVRQRYEKRAASWHEAGRPADLLETDVLALLIMECWLYSDGAKYECKQEEISETFLDFAVDSMNAELARDVYWKDRIMKERDYCEICTSRWMYDNLALCTDCKAGFCIDCMGRFPYHVNGNRCCDCGGEIVG
jgi:hypothetical protein